MPRLPRHLAFVMALLGFLVAAPTASAGWVTVKNETSQTIIIQEMCTLAGKPVRGKAVRLLPGETYREYHARAGEKQVHLYDDGEPKKLLADETMTWHTRDQNYAIQTMKSTTRLVTETPTVAKK